MPSPIGFAERFCSNPERSGRDGFLGLRFERRPQKTILARCRFRLPLQALTPVELADGTAYLMMLNPTGGLVGGDYLFTEVIQEAGTRVCLTTPSATRVYRTRGQPAVQQTHVRVGQCAVLEYLPDHIIPNRDSKLRQSLSIEMERGSRAIFWDALAAGRIGYGERWNFRELYSSMEVSICGHPVFVNRTRICPAELAPERLGFAEGFHYLATFLVVADEFDDWKKATATMETELRNMPQVYGSASALSQNGCVVKLLARSAADLMSAQAVLWGQARQIVLGCPAFDLRKY